VHSNSQYFSQQCDQHSQHLLCCCQRNVTHTAANITKTAVTVRYSELAASCAKNVPAVSAHISVAIFRKLHDSQTLRGKYSKILSKIAHRFVVINPKTLASVHWTRYGQKEGTEHVSTFTSRQRCDLLSHVHVRTRARNFHYADLKKRHPKNCLRLYTNRVWHLTCFRMKNNEKW